MIGFLEMLYISTVLSMVGSFIKTMDDSNDKAFVEHLRVVIREVVEAVGISPQVTLKAHYKEMIEMIGLPDPLAEKTHNQLVAEEILRELGEG
jgi:transcription initiation factor TFIIIB Brf1 subunit/transcription initiation factor TFIIB